MNDNKIIAFRFAGDLMPEEHSDAMKRVFSCLYESGGITYSQFLFPYVDSLLLSDESDSCFFGSHALLWDIAPERLIQCAQKACGEELDRLKPQVSEIELSAPSAAVFMHDAHSPGKGIGIGDLAALLSGNVRPWSVREHSRGLCSFAEHIARMKGYTVHGFSGGRLVISAEGEADEQALAALYTSKTGGIAGFIKY